MQTGANELHKCRAPRTTEGNWIVLYLNKILIWQGRGGCSGLFMVHNNSGFSAFAFGRKNSPKLPLFLSSCLYPKVNCFGKFEGNSSGVFQGERIYTCHNFKIINIFLTPTQMELAIGSYLNKVAQCQFYICWSKCAKKEGRKEGREGEREDRHKMGICSVSRENYKFLFQIECKVFNRQT